MPRIHGYQLPAADPALAEPPPDDLDALRARAEKLRLWVYVNSQARRRGEAFIELWHRHKGEKRLVRAFSECESAKAFLVGRAS